MNEKEKKEFYIAMCRCCLIAEAMKGCPTCRFNIGLTEPVKPLGPTLVSFSIQIEEFAIPEEC